MSPNLARRTHERRLSPNRRALALEALMLLLLPPPKAITDVMIECTKNCARAGTEAVKMTPSAEERIDLLEQLSERLTSRRPLCLLLDRIAQGGRDAVASASCLNLRAMLHPSLVAFLDRTECDVGQQRRDNAALGRAFGGR